VRAFPSSSGLLQTGGVLGLFLVAMNTIRPSTATILLFTHAIRVARLGHLFPGEGQPGGAFAFTQECCQVSFDISKLLVEMAVMLKESINDRDYPWWQVVYRERIRQPA
jgi:hypothetical protein